MKKKELTKAQVQDEIKRLEEVNKEVELKKEKLSKEYDTINSELGRNCIAIQFLKGYIHK